MKIPEILQPNVFLPAYWNCRKPLRLTWRGENKRVRSSRELLLVVIFARPSNAVNGYQIRCGKTYAKKRLFYPLSSVSRNSRRFNSRQGNAKFPRLGNKPKRNFTLKINQSSFPSCFVQVSYETNVSFIQRLGLFGTLTMLS